MTEKTQNAFRKRGFGVTRKIKAAFTNLLERWPQFTTNTDSRELR